MTLKYNFLKDKCVDYCIKEVNPILINNYNMVYYKVMHYARDGGALSIRCVSEHARLAPGKARAQAMPGESVQERVFVQRRDLSEDTLTDRFAILC